MSQYDDIDFFTKVSLGLVPGMRAVIIVGHNAALALDTEEDLSEAGGTLSLLTSGEKVHIASTSTNDRSAQTGALTLKIEGIADTTYASQSETVTLNGSTNVTSSLTYLRINKLTCLTFGSGRKNAGNITATAVTASTVQAEADAGESTSQDARYTIPANHSMVIKRVEMNAAKLSGGSKPVIEFKGIVSPYGSGSSRGEILAFDRKMDTDTQDQIALVQDLGPRIAAKADIKMTATADTTNSEARTRMFCILIDDNVLEGKI